MRSFLQSKKKANVKKNQQIPINKQISSYFLSSNPNCSPFASYENAKQHLNFTERMDKMIYVLTDLYKKKCEDGTSLPDSLSKVGFRNPITVILDNNYVKKANNQRLKNIRDERNQFQKMYKQKVLQLEQAKKEIFNLKNSEPDNETIRHMSKKELIKIMLKISQTMVRLNEKLILCGECMTSLDKGNQSDVENINNTSQSTSASDTIHDSDNNNDDNEINSSYNSDLPQEETFNGHIGISSDPQYVSTGLPKLTINHNPDMNTKMNWFSSKSIEINENKNHDNKTGQVIDRTSLYE